MDLLEPIQNSRNRAIYDLNVTSNNINKLVVKINQLDEIAKEATEELKTIKDPDEREESKKIIDKAMEDKLEPLIKELKLSNARLEEIKEKASSYNPIIRTLNDELKFYDETIEKNEINKEKIKRLEEEEIEAKERNLLEQQKNERELQQLEEEKELEKLKLQLDEEVKRDLKEKKREKEERNRKYNKESQNTEKYNESLKSRSYRLY